MLETLAILATAGLTVWMAVHCYRNEPDRLPWLIVIVAVPTLGPVLYFLARWLPSRPLRKSSFVGRIGSGKELKRLQWEADTIGNPHQWTALGDGLRERGQWSEARAAYEKAVAKDRESLPARWGAALTAFQEKDFASAREHLNHILVTDDRYKFGDASLLLGKCLASEGREAEALLWMKKHVERWRQPEGLFLYAKIQAEGGLNDGAAATLNELLGELEHAPPAVARKHSFWKRRAKKLLREVRVAS